jgi:hypothetical protein
VASRDHLDATAGRIASVNLLESLSLGRDLSEILGRGIKEGHFSIRNGSQSDVFYAVNIYAFLTLGGRKNVSVGWTLIRPGDTELVAMLIVSKFQLPDRVITSCHVRSSVGNRQWHDDGKEFPVGLPDGNFTGEESFRYEWSRRGLRKTDEHGIKKYECVKSRVMSRDYIWTVT